MIENAILEAEKKLRRELTEDEREALVAYIKEDLTEAAITFATVLGKARDELRA
ncbi:hypothetical protein [Shimia thalassica]|uniref:hypothetical protein n=1 Tax=Shimia thalassica TaxID=1715693 RepID=UPI0026E18459|nr:hypothetical protein [Shimia thalassica]MDO6483560.1 hypothetical protein [Shimia thalassica]